MYILYYLHIISEKNGERYILGRTTDLQKRLESYMCEKPSYHSAIILEKYETKAEILDAITTFKLKYQKNALSSNKLQYKTDILGLFNDSAPNIIKYAKQIGEKERITIVYHLYYLYIVDEQFGTRYIIGISTNIASRLKNYLRSHTKEVAIKTINTFNSKQEALAAEKKIKDKYTAQCLPTKTEEFDKDILGLFNTLY